MPTESRTLRLHIVDLAFALFAADYVEHDDLQEGTSYEELAIAGAERHSIMVEVSPALGRYAFYLVMRFQGKYPSPTDRRSGRAQTVSSQIRRRFHAARLPAPG